MNIKSTSNINDLEYLRVAVVSKSDRYGGGASLIAEQLTLALRQYGHAAHHWVAWWGDGLEPHMRSLYGIRYKKCLAKLHKIVGAFGLQELIPWEYANIRRHFAAYQIAHFHDISSAISPYSIKLLSRRMPVVWTFHDCSPFTGGCLHPMDCNKFETGCHDCPQLGRWPLQCGINTRLHLGLDFSGFMQLLKRRMALQRSFVPVTPSQWMADQAMRSGMFAQRPIVIPNWVDVDTFRPMPKKEIREQLGLPLNEFLLIFFANYLGNSFKGVEYLIEAARRCQRPLSIILVGRAEQEMMKLFQGLSVIYKGFIADRALLARYIAAADVAINPTLAESFSCATIEAMACETPTIAFAVGGVPDLIDHGHTGWLVKAKDVDGLVQGLQLFYDHPELRRQWARQGRKNAVLRYHRDVFLKAHVNLYRSLLQNGGQIKCTLSLRERARVRADRRLVGRDEQFAKLN
ncbi:MAG: glycosyltransferase [Thermoguttaceae bacterium]|jgi:glycosyltransferase involved in cell wall biosynthesis